MVHLKTEKLLLGRGQNWGKLGWIQVIVFWLAFHPIEAIQKCKKNTKLRTKHVKGKIKKNWLTLNDMRVWPVNKSTQKMLFTHTHTHKKWLLRQSKHTPVSGQVGHMHRWRPQPLWMSEITVHVIDFNVQKCLLAAFIMDEVSKCGGNAEQSIQVLFFYDAQFGYIRAQVHWLRNIGMILSEWLLSPKASQKPWQLVSLVEFKWGERVGRLV